MGGMYKIYIVNLYYIDLIIIKYLSIIVYFYVNYYYYRHYYYIFVIIVIFLYRFAICCVVTVLFVPLLSVFHCYFFLEGEGGEGK